MKWLLSTILSAAVLVSSCAAVPLPPPPNLHIIQTTERSIVRLLHEEDNGDYSACTGFLTDSIHILTAAHCIMKDVTANLIPVRLVKNTSTLALYESPALLGVPVKFRDTPLNEGEEVVAVGFGMGLRHVFTRHVAIPLYDNNVLLDGLLIPGMSGGPVVDLEGKVVGLVQAGRLDTITVLTGQDELKQFLKK